MASANVEIGHIHFALTLAKKSLTYDNYLFIFQQHKDVCIDINPREDKIGCKQQERIPLSGNYNRNSYTIKIRIILRHRGDGDGW